MNHDAARLTIFADDAQVAESYPMFLSYSSQTPTARDEGKGLVTPTDRETFDAWMEFMLRGRTSSFSSPFGASGRGIQPSRTI